MLKQALRRAVIHYSVSNRRRKAEMIGRFIEARQARTVILAGAVGSASEKNESVVERALEGKARIISAFDVVPAQTPWPYVVGDARAMPYRRRAADLLVSNAVIEHVGGE